MGSGRETRLAESLNRSVDSLRSGSLDEALEHAEQAYRLARRGRGLSRHARAYSALQLGQVKQALGERREAADSYREAESEVVAAGHCDDERPGSLLQALALRHLSLGEPGEAERLQRGAVSALRATSPVHPELPAALDVLARLCRNAGRPEEAVEHYREALQVREANLGQDHAEVGITLMHLGELERQAGRYRAAETLLRRGVEVLRVANGEDHPEYAIALANLAALHQLAGSLEEAEQLYLRASLILEKDPNSPEALASLLGNLGVLALGRGDYASALTRLESQVELLRKLHGEDNPEFARALNNLAGYFQETGDYRQAGSLLARARTILEAHGGESQAEYPRVLHNLASLHRRRGEYEAARQVFERAVEIRRRTLGENHPETAQTLSMLGDLEETRGNYVKAEQIQRHIAEIHRQTLGECHTEYATALFNQARLLRTLGDLGRAEGLLRKVIEIDRQTLGEDHSRVADGLGELANLYSDRGDFDAAEALHCQALEILGRAFGPSHPAVASGLSGLGEVLRRTGRAREAEMLHRRALEIRLALLGDAHPDVAESCNNLALALEQAGKTDEAESSFRKALEIREKALGEAHPDVVTGTYNLATFCRRTGRPGEALELMDRAANLEDRLVAHLSAIASERQRLDLLARLRKHVFAFLTLIVEHHSKSPSARRKALELTLRRKGLAAEVLAAQGEALLSGRYPSLAPRLEDLAALRARVASATLAGPDRPGLDASVLHRKLLEECNEQREQLERELAAEIPEMGREVWTRRASTDQLARALPRGSALVEFVRYYPYSFLATPETEGTHWRSARYLVFILLAGKPDDVRLIDLGEADALETQAATFLRWVGNATPRLTSARELVSKRHGDRRAGEAVGDALRAALIDPLAPSLGSRTRLFLPPDGELSCLPFEVLPMPDERPLLDHYRVSYLSTGRDLLRFRKASGVRARAAVVIADPDFRLTAKPAAVPPVENERTGSLRGAADGLSFPRLPGTEQEGRKVSAALGVRPWMGARALEGRLREKRSPRVLHLATHGFFLEQKEDLPVISSWADIDAIFATRAGRLSPSAMSNPLLRSGLALAGAESWLRGKPLPPKAEDGILTAEDVSGLDLAGTALVVLSACETGLGAVEAGEGVFGLRRSFVLAGARALVMSLWKVPDEPTSQLMADFYRRLSRGTGVVNALRGAQQAIRKTFPVPSVWGAFICQGDPEVVISAARRARSTRSATRPAGPSPPGPGARPGRRRPGP
jgi:tetratricopeptide (TPR) repeat protein/CHAT domain-containing protein